MNLAQTVEMTRGRCPTCGGRLPTPWEDNARCSCGHGFDPNDLHVKASSGAVGALWSAVHALEDKASSGRWRSRQPQPPPHLEETIEKADEEADAIREVLKQRDAAPPPDEPGHTHS